MNAPIQHNFLVHNNEYQTLFKKLILQKKYQNSETLGSYYVSIAAFLIQHFKELCDKKRFGNNGKASKYESYHDLE